MNSELCLKLTKFKITLLNISFVTIQMKSKVKRCYPLQNLYHYLISLHLQMNVRIQIRASSIYKGCTHFDINGSMGIPNLMFPEISYFLFIKLYIFNLLEILLSRFHLKKIRILSLTRIFFVLEFSTSFQHFVYLCYTFLGN